MPKFGKRSKEKLATCQYDLIELFSEVIQHYDCTVLEGARSDKRQYELFRQGKSKLDGIKKKSKHQTSHLASGLSKAADIVPYPIDWNDTNRFYHFGGLVKGIATQLGIPIRWGGDWNNNNILDDQTFFDLPHFELI